MYRIRKKICFAFLAFAAILSFGAAAGQNYWQSYKLKHSQEKTIVYIESKEVLVNDYFIDSSPEGAGATLIGKKPEIQHSLVLQDSTRIRIDFPKQYHAGQKVRIFDGKVLN